VASLLNGDLSRLEQETLDVPRHEPGEAEVGSLTVHLNSEAVSLNYALKNLKSLLSTGSTQLNLGFESVQSKEALGEILGTKRGSYEEDSVFLSHLEEILHLVYSLLAEVLLVALLVEESVHVLQNHHTRLLAEKLAEERGELRAIELREDPLVEQVDSNIRYLQVTHQCENHRGFPRRGRAAEEEVFAGSLESQREKLVESPDVVLSIVDQLLLDLFVASEVFKGNGVKLD
jgi:hypothetical protein